MPLVRYVVISTANWKDKADPLLANVHGIYENLEAANNLAKAVLSKEIGTYKIDYDEDGCVIVDDEEDDGASGRFSETKKLVCSLPLCRSVGTKSSSQTNYLSILTLCPRKATTKKDLFRVRVVKHIVSNENGTNEKSSTAQSTAPQTFTKEIDLYYFTRVDQFLDRCGEIDKEKFQEGKYFLGKRAALEYFHASRCKHDICYRNETVEEFIEDYIDEDRGDMPEHFIE